MATLSGILCSLALLAIVGAGLSTIVGAKSMQEWFFRRAIVLVLVSLALPIVGKVLATMASTLPNVVGNTPSLPDFGQSLPYILIVIGHIALLIILVRRRLRGAGRGTTSSRDVLERVRSRRRERLSPDGEESEE